MQITEDDCASFHRDGAVLLKGVLEQKWLDLIEKGLEFAENHPNGLLVFC